MKKAICLGNGLSLRTDLPQLVSRGINGVLIAGDIATKPSDCEFARQCGVDFLIVDVSWKPQMKQTVDQIDAEYYYIDEPYAMKHHSDEELKEIVDYIKLKRPNSKFIIGDIRVIQEKKYKPIPGLYYTYTSYINNWFIPIVDKCLPFGGPDQSPSLRRIHKKTGGMVPFIWVYGQNKLLCHPDEYHKLYKTGEELGVDFLMFYAGDGGSGAEDKYRLNQVTKAQLWDNLDHFIKNEKPYTFTEWWKRFFNRWAVSFSYLFKTWNFKDFINTLF